MRLILREHLNISVYVISICRYNNYSKLFKICFDDDKHHSILEILNSIGHISIPPYLKRSDESIDYELYQTIYGINPGSIAASTAGLHFDSVLIKNLIKIGIEIAFITLHIDSVTFQPV